MHTTYIWHQFHLHRRKISLLVLFISFCTSIQAQTKVYNRRFLENYDDKLTHFGFYFGTGFSRFNIKHSDTFGNPADPTLNITSPVRFAFKVGMVANRYLTRHWDIRTTPGINITSKEMRYDMRGAPAITDERDLDYFELPVLMKFKSDRRKNSRMYMLAGGNFLIETNIRRGQKSLISKLPTKTSDFCIEYGAGFEQFLEFGKFSGELRFSHGLRNLFLTDTAKPHTQGISALNSHAVTVYLFFE